MEDSTKRKIKLAVIVVVIGLSSLAINPNIPPLLRSCTIGLLCGYAISHAVIDLA